MIILCGTNRPNANSRKVANRVLQLTEAVLSSSNSSLTAKLLDLKDLSSGDRAKDLFSPESYGNKPDWFVSEFQEPMLNAKGLLVVVPEYNGSFPGALKYFIDMLKFPGTFNHLPVALIGIAAGQFGGLRAVEQLEVILHYQKAHIFGERVFVPAIQNIIAEDGTLSTYEERISKQVQGFCSFVESQLSKLSREKQ